MTTRDALDDAIYLQIEILSQEGNILLEDDGDWRGAIAKWQAALALVPEPKTDWSAALWLYASIGTAWLDAPDMAQAQDAFETAYRCPDGHLNPYVLLQLGKIYAISGSHDAATKMLLRAYMLDGEAIFAEDPGQLDYLRARVDLSKPTMN